MESAQGPGLNAGLIVNRGQELVIGGYIPGPHGFDSLIVGYYRGKDLVYVARVRNGFVPATRRQVFEKIRYLVSPTMPFVNLPDTHKSRWGDELSAEKMKECVWLRCRDRIPHGILHFIVCRSLDRNWRCARSNDVVAGECSPPAR